MSNVACPWGCPGGSVVSLNTMSTLLGWWPPNPDPNHHTQSLECRTCQRVFTKQWCREDGPHHAIIDQHNKVLSGTPPKCCASKYLTKCEKCGGWVAHVQRGKAAGFGGTPYQPMQDMSLKCETCLSEYPDPRWGIFKVAKTQNTPPPQKGSGAQE